MAVSSTTEQLEYVTDNATDHSESGSLVPGTETVGKFDSSNGMCILSLLIALAGLVGNSLVLWFLGFRIQRNPVSVYILNLAGADALFLCSLFPISIHTFVKYLHMSIVTRAVPYVTYVLYSVGLSLLAAISTERCLSVLFPIWYRCHRPKYTSAAVCAGLWAVSSLLGAIGFLVCRETHPSCKTYMTTEFVWSILLTCVLCVSSLTLLLRVQCSSQIRQPPRLYLLVLLTVLVFLLCGLPLGILVFLEHFQKVPVPFWLPWLLACVNSSANPFIYFFLGTQRHKRKKTFREVLQRALREDQELGMRNTSNTNTSKASSCGPKKDAQSGELSNEPPGPAAAPFTRPSEGNQAPALPPLLLVSSI